jgi:hypothetical protein
VEGSGIIKSFKGYGISKIIKITRLSKAIPFMLNAAEAYFLTLFCPFPFSVPDIPVSINKMQ